MIHRRPRRLAVDCQKKWQSICTLLSEDVVAVGSLKENTMKSKALTVQSMQEMTENRARACQVPGHSPSSHARCPVLCELLVLLIVAAGCNSAKNTLGGSGTSIQGMWTVTGNLGAQSGSETYQVAFVPSPCSVTSPVGTFSDNAHYWLEGDSIGSVKEKNNDK